MKKKIFLLLIISIGLAACIDDPVFKKEELQVNGREYIDNVSYYTADIYCQVEANISIKNVILQYSTNAKMSHAKEVKLQMTKSYPEVAEFEKINDVYYVHLTDLLVDTTYYGRILLDTPVELMTIKKNITFTTLSLSSAVTTNAATNISYTSATLNGKVVEAENVSIDQTGFYYSFDPDMKNSVKVLAGYSGGSFSKTLTDIESNKVYYFMAYAIINGTTYLGKILSFTTNEYTFAEVQTGNASDISYTSATCSMNIISAGNSTIVEKGILYGTDRKLEEISVQKATITSSSNSVTLNNLISGTRYYYRAYAINSAGVAYGAIKEFWTEDMSSIDFYIENFSNISYTSARVNFSIYSYGQDVREYGLLYCEADWSGDLKYGSSQYRKSTTVSGWKGTDQIKSSYYTLSYLQAGVIYICVLYLKYMDDYGEEQIIYSSEDYFETTSYGVPTVTTNDAKDIYTTSATISMSIVTNGSSVTTKGFYISSNYRAIYYDDDDDFERYTDIWTKKAKTTSSLTLTDLEDNTTYYYVAYATNAVGTGYGEVNSFTTNWLTYPSVTTSIVSASSSSVKVRGNTDAGGEKGVTVGFVYSSTTSYPSIENATKSVYSTSYSCTSSNNGDFTKTINYTSSSFQKNVIYYVRAYCTNSKGTSYGEVKTFEFY